MNSKMALVPFLSLYAIVSAFTPTHQNPRPKTKTVFDFQQCGWSSVRLSAKKSGTKKKKSSLSKDGMLTVAVNRAARRNYEILETYEAGISLRGTEVKSIRDGKLNLRDGYIRPNRDGRSCTLVNVHLGKHSHTGLHDQHEEKRPRTLLLHKSQSRKLLQQTERGGMTVVPIKAYFNERNLLKLQIALCRGKNVRDKRRDIQNREAKRDADRMIKSFRIS